MIEVVLTLTIAASLSLGATDLVPGHLTTVWWDEACGCRRVVVEAVDDDHDVLFDPLEVADGG